MPDIGTPWLKFAWSTTNSSVVVAGPLAWCRPTTRQSLLNTGDPDDPGSLLVWYRSRYPDGTQRTPDGLA